MRPTTAYNPKIFHLDAIVHPDTKFKHLRDVVAHAGLTTGEKRAILASWASDAAAIKSCPSLRAPTSLKAPVSIDEIVDALRLLDGEYPRNPPGGKPNWLRSTDRALAA
jgi:hypothetical protein